MFGEQFIGEEVGFAAVVLHYFTLHLKIGFRAIIFVGGESRIEIFRLKLFWLIKHYFI